MHARSARPSLRRALRAVGVVLGLLCFCVVQAAPLRVAVISDLNGSYGSTRYHDAVPAAMDRILSLEPDLVISTGDMVAGQRLQPLLADETVVAMWASFHRVVTDRLAGAGIPLAVTPGNHDASGYSPYRAERERYALEWGARRPAVQFLDAGKYPFHYAFALGDVLFVSLDVTRTEVLDVEQRTWLEGLLERLEGRFTHRVAFSHLPIHPVAIGRQFETSGDLELEALLARHGFELYLSGHHHAYYPGYHGGIRHVSQACLGTGPRALIGTRQRSPRGLTWIEFDADQVRVDLLMEPDFTVAADLQRLPAAIRHRNVELVREDLRPRSPNPNGL